MRELRVRPKIETVVAIPTDLREFARHANELIVAGDNFAIWESDDLIQTPSAYGGLIEEGGDMYGVTFFPQDNIRPKWEMTLSSGQLADIAAGRLTELKLWACVDPNCGSHFSNPDAACFDCDYDDPELDERKRFMLSIADVSSREEWATAYFRQFPDAHPMQMIGEYNGHANLIERLGAFSMNEAMSIKASI